MGTNSPATIGPLSDHPSALPVVARWVWETWGSKTYEETVASLDDPENCPPTVVAQHMPEHFLESFANRLDNHCAPKVRLARGGDVLKQGEVLLAAGGDHHVRVRGVETPSIAAVPDDGSALYVPSVEVLFRSAVSLGEKAIGVMLTGMGRDGASFEIAARQWMREAMRKAGAHTIAQSPETVVVDGMPRAARECGAVIDVCDIDRVGARILEVASKGARP